MGEKKSSGALCSIGILETSISSETSSDAILLLDWDSLYGTFYEIQTKLPRKLFILSYFELGGRFNRNLVINIVKQTSKSSHKI